MVRLQNDYESMPALTVESHENHVYFYSDVTSDRCLALMKILRDLEKELLTEKYIRNINYQTPIWLHINSTGGELFSAFAVADQIKQLHVPVYSVIEGVAASAATIISTACTKRYIQRNSFVMIHQFESTFWGTHEEFKDELSFQHKLFDRMVKWYSRHTKLTKKDIKKKVLKSTFWMDAKEAVKYGVADKIYQVRCNT